MKKEAVVCDQQQASVCVQSQEKGEWLVWLVKFSTMKKEMVIM